MLALARSQKLPAYDEHTVFGLPSRGHDEIVGVAQCMKRDEVERSMTGDHLVKPPKKLMGEIEGLEEILRHGYMPIDRYEKLRPMTARLLVPKAQDPRIPRVSPRGALSAREGSVPASSSPRRKLSSIAAYRKAGIDPTYSLLPSTTAHIERWRSYPKFEEQMMLGYLKSQSHNLVPQPPWRIKRFQNVQSRI